MSEPNDNRDDHPIAKEDYWPCACVKRDKIGNLAAIRLNHPSVATCKKCTAKRPE